MSRRLLIAVAVGAVCLVGGQQVARATDTHVPTFTFAPDVAAQRYPDDGSVPLISFMDDLPRLGWNGATSAIDAGTVNGLSVQLTHDAEKTCAVGVDADGRGGSICVPTDGRRFLEGRLAATPTADTSLELLLLDSGVSVSSVQRSCDLRRLAVDDEDGVILWGCTPPAQQTVEVDVRTVDGAVHRAQIVGTFDTGG